MAINKYSGHGPIPEEIHQAARLLWESSRDMTHADVGKLFNISVETIKSWSSREDWSKAHKVYQGQVIPAPKRALRVVRQEMAASGGEPISPERMQHLARVEHNRMRDARARSMDAMQNNLMMAMYRAANGPITEDNFKKVSLIKVAMDAISKMHKQQAALWRMNEGPMPNMGRDEIVDVGSDN